MKKRNKWLSGMLAATLTISQVATTIPMAVLAAPENAITAAKETRAVTETWRHFASGAQNDNGANAAILVNTNEGTEGMEAGEISFVLKPNTAQAATRFNVGPYIKDNGNYMTIGYNATGWFYEYKGAGNDYPSITLPTPPGAGQEMQMSIKWDGVNYTVTADGQEATFAIPQEAFDGLKTGKLGFRIGSWGAEVSDISFKDVTIKDGEGNVVVEAGTDTWELQTTGKGEVYEDVSITKVTVSGKVVDDAGNAVSGAEVTLDGKTVTTGKDGSYSFEEIVTGTYALSVAKKGYQAGTAEVVVEDEDVVLEDVVLEMSGEIEFEADDTLVTGDMEVAISNTFPQVFGYTLKGGANDGKKFYGQTARLTQMLVSNKLVTPEVAYEKVADNKAVYTMTIDEQDLKATITAELVAEKNTLAFNITKIEAADGTVSTISIPDHNLVTVKASQSGARFDGANMSTSTTTNGDTHAAVSAMSDAKRGYMYAFVSTDELSAGLWSNSENNVTSDWQRVTAVTSTVDGVKETSLMSTYWTYQKTPEHRKEDKAYEMPSTKVVITGDENADETIDWQDGAIAYRTIMNNPVGAELVPDRVALRIAMNFNGHAQNPFLMTYDNAQKVYLHTDGLGQSILLKGYGSEGHDSGHLNYADIGRRIGGTEEMKKLLAQGKEIGATFGIHVNASETYPESIYFTEDRLKKNGDGSLSYGWNWLDQGVNIDADYDLRHGREQRFVDLYNELGGKDNDLDFIYVDVWGNGQSGDNGTWASRQLAKEITQTCGWRLASEWGYANEYDSTFQHWAADLTYGGAGLKGINSYITRFIRNHQKDSWIGDYPSYGGAAVEPLLGGYDMKDFEGWQGRNDYLGYMYNLFDDNLTTKFLQHYKVMKWEDGEPTTVGGSVWTPEMKITLQDDARKNTVVIERKSNNGASAEYRERVMTINGRVIMDGQKYLVPWFWDANGKELADKDQKLYHWNQQGGTSTWELPEGWEGANLYELTETGNVEANDIATISGGKVTINAKAGTAYVMHKAGAGSGITSADLTWSKGSHLVDTGFNSGTLAHWDIKGESAEVIRSAASNMMLSVGNETEEVSLTQTITDLVPGKGYAAYVGVDNRSDAKAFIEVAIDGKVVDSNYTERSIARNYIQSYAHNTNNATTAGTGSYFQNMYTFFTAPESGEVTLTLRREAGAGKTYFDDPRVVNNVFGEEIGEGLEKDGNFNPYESKEKIDQTFEAVPQGLFPFVIGNIENVQDNRTHLSEKHAPYTQAGWDVKKLDDVLDGNWSVKTNGLAGYGRLAYQTIPQNFRFEEGVTYNVSFDYEMGSADTYRFAVGNGESNGSNFATYQLKEVDLENCKPQNFKIRVTGAEGNQSWIGIYSTTNGADTDGTTGSAANFGGYKDFMLDNLVIEKSQAQTSKLEALVDANDGRYEVNYTAESWAVFADALAEANAVIDDFDATQEMVDAAVKALEEAVAGLDVIAVTLSGRATDEKGAALANIEISVNNGEEKVVTTTDRNGNYVLPGVLFGERTVVAESNIFSTNTAEFTASKDELEVTQDFTMVREKVTVEGTVTAVGDPVKGATVTIGDQTVKTDADGHYKFDEVLTRAYTVTASKAGYDSVSKDVVIEKGKAVVLNFVLPPLTRDEADYENNYDDGVKTWDNLAGNTSSTAISVVDGETRIAFPGGHANVYETNAPKFKNGMVEMDIRAEKAGTRVGINLRSNDMNNRAWAGCGDSANAWFSEHWGKGGNAWSAMYGGPTFAAGETMHLKAEIVEKTITLWVNGQKMFSNTMNGMPMEAGYVGLNCRASNVVYVDNFKVTSYDEPVGKFENVAGRVVSGFNAGIKDLAVELCDNEGNVLKTTTTDALGNYKFKNVEVGEYKVRVTYNDETVEKAVSVEVVEDYIVVEKVVYETGVDIADLAALVDVVDSMDLTIYTDETETAAVEALAAAEAVINNGASTQEEVDAALEALQAAKDALRLDPIHKADLVEAVKEAEEMAAEIDKYIPAPQETFTKALEAAKAVVEDEKAMLEDVEEAFENLKNAMAAMELIPDKTELIAAIEEANEIDLNVYTAQTALAVSQAIDAAQAVVDDENAVEEDVAAALEALITAVEGLEESVRPELSGLIAIGEELVEEDFTSASWKVFSEALANAKEALAGDDEEEMKAAAAELEEAITAMLEELAIRIAFEEFYAACKEFYKEENYSKANWNAYMKAMEAAEKVLADKESSMDVMIEALEDLIEATEALDAEDAEKPGTDKPQPPTKPEIPTTGDDASSMNMMLMMMLLAAGVVAVLVVRRRRQMR